MTIETYCPEIDIITRLADVPDKPYMDDLIAAALRREIIRRGEWIPFVQFSRHFFWDGRKGSDFADAGASFDGWLMDPSTFIRVAGEWVGREDKS